MPKEEIEEEEEAIIGWLRCMIEMAVAVMTMLKADVMKVMAQKTCN